MQSRIAESSETICKIHEKSLSTASWGLAARRRPVWGDKVVKVEGEPDTPITPRLSSSAASTPRSWIAGCRRSIFPRDGLSLCPAAHPWGWQREFLASLSFFCLPVSQSGTSPCRASLQLDAGPRHLRNFSRVSGCD